jgi:hypothetical protein
MKVVDLLRELRSFSASGVTDSDIEKFENSKSEVPSDLLDGWCSGEFDEDPEYLACELKNLAPC